MAENLRFNGKVTGVRITKTADWCLWVSPVELPDAHPRTDTCCYRHRCGLKQTGNLEHGRGIRKPSIPQNGAKKLRRRQQASPSACQGSKNREKARRQVARLHYRITCMRDDALHKLTTRLADCYGIVGIEDLNLKGLLKNANLLAHSLTPHRQAAPCSRAKWSSVMGR